MNHSTATGLTLTNEDYFGMSVALDVESGLLAVGADGDDTEGGGARGAVYLIDRGDDDWASVVAADVTKIDSSTDGVSLANADRFGYAVALDGGVLTIGASQDDEGGTDTGAVHLFDSAFIGVLATGDFEKDSTATPGDGDLAEGQVTVTATATDRAGNAGTAATGVFVYDITPPTVSSVYSYGTTMTVVLSEAVWGSVDANDFTVTGGNAPSVSSVSGACGG